MNIIHVFDSDSENIQEGEIVRTRCGMKFTFRPHGALPKSGKICVICNGFPRIIGNPPFLRAVLEEKSVTQTVLA